MCVLKVSLNFKFKLTLLVFLFEGMLKPDECRWLLTEYNDIYSLSIPKDVLEDSIKSSSTAQGTSIDSILKEILQTVQ